MLSEEDVDVIDSEIADVEDKISDLRSLKEPTNEQREELKNLQADRKSRLEKRTKALLGRAKAAEDRARRAEEKALELETKFTAAEKRLPAQPASRPKITVDGEEFFTDVALQAMVREGEMTESEAWDHQEARRVAAAAERLAKKSEKNSFEKTRTETITTVLKEYPHLNPNHPKYSLDDPFTAEVDRLLRNGYQFKPDGLKNAVEDAKRTLRMTDKRPDLSDEFSVASSTGGADKGGRREVKVELEEWERDNAVRMWVNTGMVNSKTGKPFTKAEAIEKALIAKKNRMAETAAR